MRTETMIIAAALVMIAILLVKKAARALQQRELPAVSHQWLLEQRGREEA